ncbi:MAG TPA: DUF2079 domain-containing protein [Caldilineaceae bacterium]|nr:DUF2079 domain-containing protein [Caldilineaceae bacterium]
MVLRSLTHRSLPILLLWLAVIAYAITFSYLTLVRYYAFEARALDMGNLNQTVWNTAHGNWFHLTNQPGTVNRLSLHVEPILIPLSWLYWVYSGPPTLLVVQATTVALAAVPLFALGRAQLGNGWAALALAVALLLTPALQAANWLEFHPLTLAPTFLLAAFYFLLAGRAGLFALFAVLAASCKEEVALLVLMMGLYALVVQRRVWLGLATVALSLAWALAAVLVIQNLFAEGNIHWGRYAYLGETPGEMVWALLTRPDLVWAQLRAAGAGRYFFELLWPTGFLALLAPEVLLLALPSLAINLLADFPPMHQVHTLIYAAPIVPLVLAATVFGLARLADWLGGRHTRQGQAAILLGAGAALLCTLVAQRLHGYLPGSGNYLPLTITDHHRRAAALIAQIPPEAKVSAQDRLNPHVSGRETVYIFPRLEDADTVFVDVTGPAWPQHPSDLRATVDELLESGFGIAAADDGYLLLRQGEENRTLPPAFYTAWLRPGYTAATGQVEPVQFGDELRLLDYRVTTDRYGELVATLVWEALRPLDEDYRFYIAYLDTEGNLLHDSEYYQPVAVLWYPTSRWTPGTPVAVATLPWTLEAERFVLAVGVYSGEGGWHESLRLPVAGDAPVPVLEGRTLARLGGYRRTPAGGWEAIVDEAPPPARSLAVFFGEQIELTGVTLPETAHPGGSLPFTLHWRARGPAPRDYTVFVHLVDGQGQKLAQLDWQPHDHAGRLPMSAWVPGRPVVDSQTLALPAELAPGSYRLIVGLYYWEDGERPPVRGAQPAPGLDNGVELGTILIE